MLLVHIGVCFFSFSFFAFFVYMLAVCMFYGWPALLTFGFSGNLALYYLCWIAVIIPYLSQINFFFFFFWPPGLLRQTNVEMLRLAEPARCVTNCWDSNHKLSLNIGRCYPLTEWSTRLDCNYWRTLTADSYSIFTALLHDNYLSFTICFSPSRQPILIIIANWTSNITVFHEVDRYTQPVRSDWIQWPHILDEAHPTRTMAYILFFETKENLRTILEKEIAINSITL